MYSSIEEAQAAKSDLVGRIQSIDNQLSYRAAEVKGGRVPDTEYKEYLRWRARACSAKVQLTTRLRRTKEWIHIARQQQTTQRIEARGGDVSLMADLYSLVKALVSDGAEISKEEQLLIDDVEAFLERN
jgi:hypothetical protein